MPLADVPAICTVDDRCPLCRQASTASEVKGWLRSFCVPRGPDCLRRLSTSGRTKADLGDWFAISCRVVFAVCTPAAFRRAAGIGIRRQEQHGSHSDWMGEAIGLEQFLVALMASGRLAAHHADRVGGRRERLHAGEKEGNGRGTRSERGCLACSPVWITASDGRQRRIREIGRIWRYSI